MSLLIRNGRIVTAADDYIADIFIEGETINEIGKDLLLKADKEIDAAGKLIFPGGIDPHVHLDMPFIHSSKTRQFAAISLKRVERQKRQQLCR